MDALRNITSINQLDISSNRLENIDGLALQPHSAAHSEAHQDLALLPRRNLLPSGFGGGAVALGHRFFNPDGAAAGVGESKRRDDDFVAGRGMGGDLGAFPGQLGQGAGAKEEMKCEKTIQVVCPQEEGGRCQRPRARSAIRR